MILYISCCIFLYPETSSSSLFISFIFQLSYEIYHEQFRDLHPSAVCIQRHIKPQLPTRDLVYYHYYWNDILHFSDFTTSQVAFLPGIYNANLLQKFGSWLPTLVGMRWEAQWIYFSDGELNYIISCRSLQAAVLFHVFFFFLRRWSRVVVV